MKPQRPVAAFETEGVGRGLLLRECAKLLGEGLLVLPRLGLAKLAELSRGARTIRACFADRLIMSHRLPRDRTSIGPE